MHETTKILLHHKKHFGHSPHDISPLLKPPNPLNPEPLLRKISVPISMARFLPLSRSFPLLKTLTLTPSSRRGYISEMRRSAIKSSLLRLLRIEASSLVPPSPPQSFSSFSVDPLTGDQRFRLTGAHHNETIKIDASPVDGAAPSSRSNLYDGSSGRLHISLVVEISKPNASDSILQFFCSAWPDALDVERLFTVRNGDQNEAAFEPFLGPDFKDLDKEMQDAVREYLEERGINDDLAGFLHEYVHEKDKGERIRWLKTVEAYVKK